MEDNTTTVTVGGSDGASAENTDNTSTVNTEGATSTDNQSGQETEKTYTQADFEKQLQSETDKRVSEALKTAQGKWQTEFEQKLQSEKDEATKLAKMTAEERAKAEIDKRENALKAEQQKYNAERLEFECTKQLATEKLPVEFAKMLCGIDADTTKANIDSFKTAYNKAIETAVNERLKSNPPKTNNGGDKNNDPFLSGFNKI